MTVQEIIRAAAALRAAVIRYEGLANAHRVLETRFLMTGDDRRADDHMRAERILLRAYEAEKHAPHPRAAEGPCGVCPGDCDDCPVCRP
jgi:hypothetical protein